MTDFSYSRYLLEGTEETHENLSQDSYLPELHSNRAPPDYKSEVLPLEPADFYELGNVVYHAVLHTEGSASVKASLA